MALFLNKRQIAEALGTSPGVASTILSERGVSPVDFGRGRGRGLRWYGPAVDVAMRQIHDEAQVKNSPKSSKPVCLPTTNLVLGRSIYELHAELTGGTKIQ